VADTGSADALDAFAAAVAHEIRTPLSALSGEVEVALRRERSAAEYREALHRIAGGVAELVDISADLALLGEATGDADARVATPLAAIMSRVRAAYGERGDLAIADGAVADARVAGDRDRVARAIALVIEHALRHRRGHPTVRVDVRATPQGVRLILTAPPSGFWPAAWRTLGEGTDDPAAPLRLRTARRILDRCGGAVRLAPAPDPAADAVHVDLRGPA
jgi:signal transduction histidine kinase